MTQLTALCIGPSPAQIQINTADTLPRFVAENHLNRISSRSQKSLGVVIFRWSRHSVQENSQNIYTQAYTQLQSKLQSIQEYQDLIFASNSQELGLTLTRDSSHHIHRLIRDLLQQTRAERILTSSNTQRSICSILSLNVGWATSCASVSGAEVLRVAEQRSYQSSHFF